MAKLRWPGMAKFQAAKRLPFYLDDAAVAAGDSTLQQTAAGASQPQSSQQQLLGSLAERQPRHTAGFVREHGPLALVTVMSAGGFLHSLGKPVATCKWDIRARQSVTLRV